MIAALTKAHAKHGKLLKDSDYLNLLSQKSTKAIEESIINFPVYSKLKKNINLFEFENDLKEQMTADLQSIALFLDKEKDFYNSYISKHEIRALKTYIRAINAKNTELLESLSKSIYAKHLNFTANQTSLGDYISRLKNTVYYRALQAFETETQNKDFDLNFYVAMSLDNFYYRSSLDNAKKLKDKAVVDYISSTIDIYNLEYLYRTQRFYNIYSSELTNYLILGGKNFGLSKLVEMSKMDFNAFVQAILNSPYQKYFKNIADEDEYAVNNDFERFKLNMAQKAFTSVRKPLLQLIAYSDLLDFQTRDICRILELNKIDFPNKQNLLMRSFK